MTIQIGVDEPRHRRVSNAAFVVAFSAYTLFALMTLVGGVAVMVAAGSPDFHQSLHVFGFADETLFDKVALGMAAASHLPQSPGGIALDYGFSIFTIGLALVLLRLRPRNRTARLLAVGMIGTAAFFNLQAYGVFEKMDAGPIEQSLNFVFQFIAAAAYFFALLTFPDGEFIPRWSRGPLTVLYGAGALVVALATYTLQGPHQGAVIIFFGLVAPVTGVASQLYRQHRSRDDAARQQARLVFWALTPALVLGLLVAAQGVTDLLFPQFEGRTLRELPVAVFRVFQPVFTIIPVALVVGIVRYRLWDVDRLISRTLVYGALAAFVTVLYVGVVIGIGNAVGSRSNLFLSIVATGIAAAAFTPLRDRFQKLANRLVYGRRATPYEVLSEFSERLNDAVETEELMGRMAQVLAQGTGATSAQVWLKVGSELRHSAAWPADLAGSPVVALGQDDDLPDFPGVRLAVPVRHQGELLGALTIEKPAAETLTETERKLVGDLASQAGLVLRNVGLTAELLARLEDLRSSRQRIVAAGNEARKRLERNIHDGAQQQLVALMVRLNLAERVAEKESPRVKEMMSQLKADTAEALETLRDLARGIYPPLLASHGLGAALEAHARKITIPVGVEADSIGRYDEETEAALYFCCLEALQNVVKSADASQAWVRLTGGTGRLEFAVEDDGRGFDLATSRRGSGLQNMIDRVEALGGTLEIRSAPGEGTCVSANVPAVARAMEPHGANA